MTRQKTSTRRSHVTQVHCVMPLLILGHKPQHRSGIQVNLLNNAARIGDVEKRANLCNAGVNGCKGCEAYVLYIEYSSLTLVPIWLP